MKGDYKSRKFWLMMLLFVTATLMFYLYRLESGEWVEFVKWIFGIYAVGNVGEHVSKNIKGTP